MALTYLTIYQLRCLLLLLTGARAAQAANGDAQLLLQARTGVHPAAAQPDCVSAAARGSLQNSRLLLFWAVGVSPKVIELVKQNIEHARSYKELDVTVYLNHYDKKDAWVNSNQSAAWYAHNVNYSSSLKGIKFWVARELLVNSNSSTSPYPRVDVASYEWLWFLDEDADFRNMSLDVMLEDARASQALILTPSIVFERHPWPKGPQTLPQTKQQQQQPRKSTKQNSTKHNSTKQNSSWAKHNPRWVKAHKKTSSPSTPGNPVLMDHNELVHQCQDKETQCELQAPSHKCRFRHTGFVEVSFPLMQPQAFLSTAGTCRFCLQNTSVWGLDRVWCAMAARNTCSSDRIACAVLDRVRLTHRDFKTLPKWEAKSAKKLTDMNYEAGEQVLHHYPDLALGVDALDCIH